MNMQKINMYTQLPPGFNKKLDILHHVNQPISKVNVAKLCEECGISRGAFYYHFESKYEIGHWYVSVCNDLSVCEIGKTLNWKDAFLKQFALVKQEEEFFYTIRDDFKDQNFLLGPFATREACIKRTLEELNIEITEKLRCEIYIYARTEVNATWQIACGYTTLSEEEYADMLVECIPRTLYDALLLTKR